MAITEDDFEKESELEDWVYANLETFLGPCALLKKFLINTSAGKGAIPDGIAFNFLTHQWYVIECELLKHGVWPHIAEQISRFVVALQNPDTSRRIRDILFEHIINCDLIDSATSQLGTTRDRLLQRIELFVESVQPQVVIFIDDTNQDLEDFARALAISTSVYRVSKFNVNGRAEYYSPDVKAPIFRIETEAGIGSDSREMEVIDLLGGGVLVPESSKERCKAYALNDGRVVQIRRAKFHTKNKYYWYGITPSSFMRADSFGTSHLVFVMGDAGFATVPIDLVKQYCERTGTTKYEDGTIRHFHVLISPDDDPLMYWSNDVPKYALSDYWSPFV